MLLSISISYVYVLCLVVLCVGALRISFFSFAELDGNFVSKGIGILCQGLGVYQQLFKRSGLADREALNHFISKSSRDVKKTAECLMEVEDEWANFLRQLEAREGERKSIIKPEVGDAAPRDVILHRVPDSLHDKLGAEVTLHDLLPMLPQERTLLVLNRHFA
ncbi:uncharacterized protein LOC125047501 [Penaeus chinensis]|uniref:uncharacterized protein LOC125047501 n=1 Tax=Penaeus chinensis TaxID=139456 RepID=UPI001FB5D368|nr:uncharacterized protein LOC125047501 [Penaeus chinensis]